MPVLRPPFASSEALFDILPPQALLGALLVVALHRLVARAGLWAYAVFALPGTLAHEFMHYGVAWLLGARPRRPDLWPRRDARGWRLGAVTFVPRWWRTGAIALAPLALMPLALLWLARFAPGTGATGTALHAWIAGTLLAAAVPSRADLRLAAPTLAAAAAVAFAVAVAAMLD